MTEMTWYGLADLTPFLRPIAQLRLDPANARRHPDESITAIRLSLATFGQTKPLVLDPRTQLVRAGNGTLMAADALGWTHIAAVTASDLSEDEQHAYALADNRTAEHSHLKQEPLLAALDAMPPDLALATGFSPDQRASIRVQLENEAALEARRLELQQQPPDVAPLTHTIVFDTKKEKAIWDGFLKSIVLAYARRTAGASFMAFVSNYQSRRTATSPNGTQSDPLPLDP